MSKVLLVFTYDSLVERLSLTDRHYNSSVNDQS